MGEVEGSSVTLLKFTERVFKIYSKIGHSEVPVPPKPACVSEKKRIKTSVSIHSVNAIAQGDVRVFKPDQGWTLIGVIGLGQPLIGSDISSCEG